MDASQNPLFNCLIAGYVFAYILFIAGLVYTVTQRQGEEQNNTTDDAGSRGRTRGLPDRRRERWRARRAMR